MKLAPFCYSTLLTRLSDFIAVRFPNTNALIFIYCEIVIRYRRIRISIHFKEAFERIWYSFILRYTVSLSLKVPLAVYVSWTFFSILALM